MIERQELHCHSCNKYVQFEIDTELNGNHVLNCPVCGHEHCRVVKDGKITSDRWESRNDGSGSNYTFTVTNVTWTNASTWTTYDSGTYYSNNSVSSTTVSYDMTGKYFLYNSWINQGS